MHVRRRDHTDDPSEWKERSGECPRMAAAPYLSAPQMVASTPWYDIERLRCRNRALPGPRRFCRSRRSTTAARRRRVFWAKCSGARDSTKDGAPTDELTELLEQVMMLSASSRGVAIDCRQSARCGMASERRRGPPLSCTRVAFYRESGDPISRLGPTHGSGHAPSTTSFCEPRPVDRRPPTAG